MQKQDNKTALLLGATGLVGKSLLKQLLQDPRYAKVTCFLRTPMCAQVFENYEDKIEPIVIDFESMQDYASYFAVDHVYVCLGTTIKKAKTKDAFQRVDYEYVLQAAQLAKAHNANSFVWISSIGAKASSSSFYLQVKGKLEQVILALANGTAFACVRPSLLVGDRAETRLAEAIGIKLFSWLGPLMVGCLKPYRPIKAEAVAAQMVAKQRW